MRRTSYCILRERYREPPVCDGAGFFVCGELSVTGETPLDERSRVVRDGVEIINLQAGYESNQFRGQLFVESLTEKRFPSGLGFSRTFYLKMQIV